MIILAVDTAGADCSVAIVRLQGSSRHILGARRDTLGRGHAEHLIPMIERMMAEAGIGFPDIERFATTIGPGSFTGLRVGVAAMRGLAVATGRPAIGIGTLEALAVSALTTLQNGSRSDVNNTGTENAATAICTALDARHGNAYAQVFAADGTPICEPRAIAADQAGTLPPFEVATGTGAPLLVDHLRQDILVLDQQDCPDPVIVATLASQKNPDEARPRPLYLKPPDAAPAPPPLPRRS
jgi:tRNA threonylcarbamoyladenosine biosynthesis protein TsaB